MDILVKRLPRYVNQFQPTIYAEHPSLYRCASASAAMCLDFAYPGKYNPFQVEHDLYTKYDGSDIASNHMGMTKEEIIKFFEDEHVGYIDMSDLVQEALNGNINALYDEIEAQNRQGVIQFLTVGDESKLREAVTNEKLHNWTDNGLSHCIVRVGFSDNEGYGFYLEPAAPAFCAKGPVKISWSKSIEPARIITAIAVLPDGIQAPPKGFRYTNGVYPKPKPVIDPNRNKNLVQAMLHAAQEQNRTQQEALKANEALLQALTSFASDLEDIKED